MSLDGLGEGGSLTKNAESQNRRTANSVLFRTDGFRGSYQNEEDQLENRVDRSTSGYQALSICCGENLCNICVCKCD
jgi:hypothetical protein